VVHQASMNTSVIVRSRVANSDGVHPTICRKSRTLQIDGARVRDAIAASSSVISAGMSAKSGVLR
jgi:hypothetical protein